MFSPFLFISYSEDDSHPEDGAFIDQLCRDLEDLNIRTWRFRTELRATRNWDSEIASKICGDEVTHLALIHTPRSVRDNSYCLNEVHCAIRCKKDVLWILLRDTPVHPLVINRLSYFDFTREDNYLSEFGRLLKEIELGSTVIPAVPASIDASRGFAPILRSKQLEAAHDPSTLVRLVAGPGTGKSFVIAERVRWLLESGVSPKAIRVVSFTRAASQELARVVHTHCLHSGWTSADDVKITTLHSLALDYLQRTGHLGGFASTPRVLDEWEQENILDAEYTVEQKDDNSRFTPTRSSEIRLAFEATCNMTEASALHRLAEFPEPVTAEDINQFRRFLNQAQRVYGCVLPGELVKRCTESISNNLTLNPAVVLGTQHLIVDEYQDLNFTDTQLISSFIEGGSHVFVAGDDDQSIYAFRYAYPTGIQEFGHNGGEVSKRTLTECFRCAPEILRVARSLILEHQIQGRIPKDIASSNKISDKGVQGLSYRWVFTDENAEAAAIAKSAESLINAGLSPNDIVILLKKRRDILSPLEKAFHEVSVPIFVARGQRLKNEPVGRLGLAILRIACDVHRQDLVALRTLLGEAHGVGLKTCSGIRQKVDNATSTSYPELFYSMTAPTTLNLTSRERTAIERVAATYAEISDWRAEDTVSSRLQAISSILLTWGHGGDLDLWTQQISLIPDNATLSELLSVLSSENEELEAIALDSIYSRLGEVPPQRTPFAERPRIMTMHGMKGLSGLVVFIPALEDGFMPDQKSKEHIGLLNEQARLLYVSITRACAAVVVSFARSRFVNGARDSQRNGSSFALHLGGPFRNGVITGLTTDDVGEIVRQSDLMRTP